MEEFDEVITSGPLHLPSMGEAGAVRMTSELSWQPLNELVDRLNTELDPDLRVDTHTQVWAGPYEVFMSIKPILDSITGLIAAGTGVGLALTQFVQRRPDQPLHIHIDASTTVIIDGRTLSSDELRAVDEFFADNDGDPNEQDINGPGY